MQASIEISGGAGITLRSVDIPAAALSHTISRLQGAGSMLILDNVTIPEEEAPPRSGTITVLNSTDEDNAGGQEETATQLVTDVPDLLSLELPAATSITFAADLCSVIQCGEFGSCAAGRCVCENGYTGSLCEREPRADIGPNATASDTTPQQQRGPPSP